MSFDCVLYLSFGGPEGPDDVMPFLRNVVRGRDVPEARLASVAAHYHHLGGVSPINARNREVIAALREELDAHGIALPVYFGNRFWKPTVVEALREIRERGHRRVLAIATSAFASYAGCRAYLESIADARAALGDDAPAVVKLPVFGGRAGYREACAARLQEVWPDDSAARLVFTAHSIPEAMAEGSDYVAQLAAGLGLPTES